eukprot:TRINITY_DN10440_c0_g1_i1.p1 TRINITY_DN10440_c0_g1~~TRINITY_DN10440_c0_g1_i1.p1  ORF type:complete len:234 (-),score=35.60 TRINITY_DN10440_c0_g1_i1:97-717(-)
MARALAGAVVLLSACGSEAATLRGSSPLDAISQTMQKMPFVAIMEETGFFNDATAFLEDWQNKEAPQSVFKQMQQDPEPSVGFFSCSRDTNGCPEGFTAGGENMQICLPDSSYRGPCNTPIDMSSMPIFAKARWADACLTTWPCANCARDYSGCPMGWTRSEASAARKCEPSAAYIGGCDATTFASDAVADLDSWASSCGAAWPCM